MRKKALPPGYRLRSDGLIELRFTFRGSRYSVFGSSVKQCDEKRDAKRQKLAEGLKLSGAKITFKEYSNEWLDAMKPTVKASTILSYTKKLQPVLSEIGSIRLADLDRRDIMSMRSTLAEHYSSSTTNYLMTMVRSILNEAVDARLINYNPAQRIKALKRTEPKATKTIHRALSKDEQKIFFEHAVGAWYYELFALMISSGLRVGEAAALRWQDIDDECIHVHSTVSQVGASAYVASSTKTDAGTRDIPLNDSIRKVVAQQRIKVAQYYGIRLLGPGCQVFYPASREGLISPSMVNSAIDVVVDRIHENGIAFERFSSHAFRDTFATRCIEQGMQPNTLKVLMGHTKISITMDLYAQVLPDERRDAMAAIQISV